MRKSISIIVVLSVLSLVATFHATEIECANKKGINVIGKATIKKGTSLSAIVGDLAGSYTAFEDQIVYILEQVPPNPGVHRGGYIADGEGFIHNCSVHGKEIMVRSLIVINIEQVEKGNVIIEIF